MALVDPSGDAYGQAVLSSILQALAGFPGMQTPQQPASGISRALIPPAMPSNVMPGPTPTLNLDNPLPAQPSSGISRTPMASPGITRNPIFGGGGYQPPGVAQGITRSPAGLHMSPPPGVADWVQRHFADLNPASGLGPPHPPQGITRQRTHKSYRNTRHGTGRPPYGGY